MIDFGICRECSFSEWHPPEESDDGEMEVYPSVGCNLFGDLLLMNSDPPSGCPNSLMHKLKTQEVPRGFANYMSGGGRR